MWGRIAPFQMDANFRVSAAVIEMWCNSNAYMLRLLPHQNKLKMIKGKKISRIIIILSQIVLTLKQHWIIKTLTAEYAKKNKAVKNVVIVAVEELETF